MTRWLAFILCCLLHAAAAAHKPSDSYLTLRTSPDSETVQVRWDIALRDLDFVLELDRDGNGELTWGEVRQRSGEITGYAMRNLALTVGNDACRWKPAGDLMLDRHSDGTYAVLALAADCDGLARGLKARYTLLAEVDPSHRGLVQWIPAGSPQARSLIFGTHRPEQALPLQPQGPWETFAQYVQEGTWHIWIGFDHILFLLALLLPAVLARKGGGWAPAPSLRAALVEVVKVVTAFTLAHSITLSLAVTGVVSLPSRLVESTIAASVVLAALANLRGSLEARRWVMAFVFGLVHGFGFASVLADLGLPPDALILSLVGFNLGVEIGQLAIVAVFLPVAFLLRRTRFYELGVLKAGSVAIALLALWWFIQRAFDIEGGPF